MPDTEEFAIDFHVDAPPEELEAWWTDLPEVYEAEDPREQPHEIELLEETGDGGIYETTWRGPLGLEFTLEEHLHDEGPGAWRFVVPGRGFEIEDRFRVHPTPDGCRLEIRSTITYDHALGELARRVMLPRWREQFRETFTNAVAVFEDRHEEHPAPAGTA
jgi:hypothetical protein